MVPDSDRDQYLQYVSEFYGQLSTTLMGMSEHDRNRFFKMLVDYSDILGTLFPNMHLVKLAKGESVEVSTEAQAAFMAWKQAQG